MNRIYILCSNEGTFLRSVISKTDNKKNRPKKPYIPTDSIFLTQTWHRVQLVYIFPFSFVNKGNLSICIMMLAPSIVWLDGSAYYFSSKKEVNEIRKHRSTKASSLSCDKSQIFSNEKNMIQFWYLHKLVVK